MGECVSVPCVPVGVPVCGCRLNISMDAPNACVGGRVAMGGRSGNKIITS